MLMLKDGVNSVRIEWGIDYLKIKMSIKYQNEHSKNSKNSR